MTAPIPAPLLRRLLALVYDALLLIAVWFLAMALLLLLGGGRMAAGSPWSSLYLLGVCIAFFGGFWTHGGQTLGMRAWRLQLVQTDGRPVTWPRAVLRVLSAVPAWLVLLLGIVLATGISLPSQAWLQPLAAGPRGSVLLAGLAWLVIDHWPGGWREKLTGTRVVLLPPTGK